MGKKRSIKQGDIYMVNLSLGSIDHEQKGIRPCVVLQNNHLNQTSENVVVVPITSQEKKKQPFHYMLHKDDYSFLTKAKNIVLTECINCISKNRLERKLGTIDKKDIDLILKNKEYVFIDKQNN